MWRFVVLFKSPLEELLQVPILNLQTALVALKEEQRVAPILKPVARRGRAPSSHLHATLRGHAAGTVKRLVETGLDRQRAHKAVAKQLEKLGVRPGRGSGVVTATTVRNWCDEVSSDVRREGYSRDDDNSMFTPREHARLLRDAEGSGEGPCAYRTFPVGPVRIPPWAENLVNPPI